MIASAPRRSVPGLALGLWARRWLGAMSLGAAMAWVPVFAAAAPAGDDWSIERKSNDPALVGQRFSKLRRNPLDNAQWRSLTKAIGLTGLAKKITAARKRRPNDVALAILDARAKRAQGDPATAAQILGQVEPKAGRLAGAVFDLRVKSLQDAGNIAAAVGAVEGRAKNAKSAAKSKLLQRAYDIADRGGLRADAQRLAQALADAAPSSVPARLRLARAARSAGQGDVADRAYATAIKSARAKARDGLTAERAGARLDADNPAGAAEILWDLLRSPRRGARADRARWWRILANAHSRDGSADVLVTRLGSWLDNPAHAKEAAAWRALASVQQATGIDPIESWRNAVQLDSSDPDAHAALVDALEADGRPKEAVQEYRRLLARGGDVQYGLELATRLIENGEPELGMAVAADIEAKAGRNARSLLLLLDFYNLNDEPDKALAVANRLVKAKARNADARIALGEQLYQMNRINDALVQWAMLPKLIRPAHLGWARHAEVLAEHGRVSEATVSLKKALKLAPQNPRYLRLRAVLAEDQRRPSLALKLWEQVRQLAVAPAQKLLRDEARTRVVELLVDSQVSQRATKLERAENEARAILDARKPLPDAVEAGRFLSELYTRRENYPAAVKVQHELLKLRPEAPQRLRELAAAQRRAGQTESAIATLEELLVGRPKRTADILAEVSELAFEVGDTARALEAATRAARQDPTQIDALIRLGELHERRGDVELAAGAYGGALEIAPHDPRAQLRLAELELTRGNIKGSAKAFRAVLEAGGPPELIREAGRRALDLAEATHSTMDLMGLAIRRTQRQPDADEPREFLIEALERVDPKQLEGWLRNGGKTRDAGRVAALRRPLVASLARGSVGARLRAAGHLGSLGLPDTAVPLAKMGAQLAPPRDATRTVRDAFERARVTAIVSAGELDDPGAVSAFAELLRGGDHGPAVRHAAAWALTRNSAAEGAKALLPMIQIGGDPLVVSLACVAVARQDFRDAAADVAAVAKRTRNLHVRHACGFAQAALLDDGHTERLRPQLRASDPVLAAIAAWRIGRRRGSDPDDIVALMVRFLGPAGLPRDAAAAALAARMAGKPAAGPITAPPTLRQGNWGIVLRRWLMSLAAPPFDPLPGRVLAPHRKNLGKAIGQAGRGTRAERAALAAALGPCEGNRGPDTTVCLTPLTDGAVPYDPAPAGAAGATVKPAAGD